MIDVTDTEPVREGAVVHLVSRDPARGPSLEDVAHVQGRAPIEVLVALTGGSYAYAS